MFSFSAFAPRTDVQKAIQLMAYRCYFFLIAAKDEKKLKDSEKKKRRQMKKKNLSLMMEEGGDEDCAALKCIKPSGKFVYWNIICMVVIN